jgi:hypothetical protein
MAFVIGYAPGTLRNTTPTTAILVRAYNKPDSVMTRIVKREKGGDGFFQILNKIAASIVRSISIWNTE